MKSESESSVVWASISTFHVVSVFRHKIVFNRKRTFCVLIPQPTIEPLYYFMMAFSQSILEEMCQRKITLKCLFFLRTLLMDDSVKQPYLTSVAKLPSIALND